MVNSKESDETRDYSMISLGFRLPKYLADYVKGYENSELGLTKTDIFRKIIEISYQQPWMLDDYLQETQLDLQKVEGITNRMIHLVRW